MFIITTHTFRGMPPKVVFFFFHLIWSPGELAQSHTLKNLFKRVVKIGYFDSLGTVSCQLKNFMPNDLMVHEAIKC